MKPTILANPFTREVDALREEYLGATARVLDSGWYILGPEVEAFERALALHCGAAHAVGCASGLDALVLTLKALGVGPGDEVITTPLSAAATALAVTHAGATPVFVDVTPATLSIDPEKAAAAVTARTRAMIVVHLYGFPAALDGLSRACRERSLHLIEDCAQAIGARGGGAPVGTVGAAGALSFYPTKNLGAFGDGGAIVPQDAGLSARLRRWRHYGQRARYDHEFAGYNSRLDELHAAVLQVKLAQLPGWTKRRQAIAHRYDAACGRLGLWHLPACPHGDECVYHLYPVQVDARDRVLAALAARGVEALVHYPTLIPEQECYRGAATDAGADLPVAFAASRRLISLPINPFLTDVEIDAVCAALEDALR